MHVQRSSGTDVNAHTRIKQMLHTVHSLNFRSRQDISLETPCRYISKPEIATIRKTARFQQQRDEAQVSNSQQNGHRTIQRCPRQCIQQISPKSSGNLRNQQREYQSFSPEANGQPVNRAISKPTNQTDPLIIPQLSSSNQEGAHFNIQRVIEETDRARLGSPSGL